MPILAAKSSCVARGGGGGEFGSPLACRVCKIPCFYYFKTNFCSKSKNSLPLVIDNKNVTALTLYLEENLAAKLDPNMGKNFFFWSSTNFGRKSVSIPSVSCFSLVSHIWDSKFLATSLAKSRPCECSQRVIPLSSQAKRIIMIFNIVQKKDHCAIQFFWRVVGVVQCNDILVANLLVAKR